MLFRRQGRRSGRAAMGGGASFTLSQTTATEGDLVEFEITGSELDGATSVEAFDNGVSIGTDVAAPFEFSIANITPGPHAITIEIDGGAPIGPSTITVSAVAPVCTSPADASSFAVGDPVTLTATVYSIADTTKVEWYLDGVTLIGTDSASLYTQSWDSTGTSLGAHTIIARRYTAAGTVDSAEIDVTATSGAFAPDDIAGLVGWFGVNAGDTFAESGGTLTSITNMATSVAYTTGTLPAYSATAFNAAYPGMDFNGTTHSIRSTADSTLLAALDDSTAFTVFIVADCDTVDRLEAMFSVGNSAQAANSQRWFGQTTAAAGKFLCRTVDSAGTIINAQQVGGSDGNPHVFCFSSNGASTALLIDDVASSLSPTAQDPTTVTPDRVGIGAAMPTTIAQFFDGKINSILVYNSDLSAGDKTLVHDYLAALVGL